MIEKQGGKLCVPTVCAAARRAAGAQAPQRRRYGVARKKLFLKKKTASGKKVLFSPACASSAPLALTCPAAGPPPARLEPARSAPPPPAPNKRAGSKLRSETVPLRHPRLMLSGGPHCRLALGLYLEGSPRDSIYHYTLAAPLVGAGLPGKLYKWAGGHQEELA